MKRIIIIFIIVPIFLKAQNIEQEIFVFDTEQRPISNISLFCTTLQLDDTISLKTDINGRFVIQGKDNEVVKLVVDNYDYSYFEEEFKISSKPKYIFLEKVTSLNEVVVMVKKKNISRSFGTTTLFIDENPIFQNSTFKDVVMLIPEINIINGNVNVLGKNKTLYLINGRESSRNVNDLSANQIEKIEVISNPSAKYQASYDSVINIVLKKNENINWYVNLNSNTYINRTTSYFNSLDVGGSFKKWSVESNLKYKFDNDFVLSNGWQDYSDKFEKYYTRFDGEKQYLETSININHSINKDNNVGIDFSYGKYPKHSSRELTKSNFNYFIANTNELVNSESNSDNRNKFINTSVYYSFSRERNSLNVYLSYIKRNQNFDNTITSNDVITLLYQNILTENDNNTFIFNSDYEFKFNNQNKLETGFRVSNFKGNYNLSTTNFSIPLSSPTFDFKENIYSLYGVYKLKIKKISFSTGLRYEYFHRNVIYDYTQKHEINQGNIFPSLHFGYESDEKNNALSLSYSKKIRRPIFNDITPFEYNKSYNTIFRGNPNLKNEFIHSVQLLYASYKLNLFLSTYFNHNENHIEDVSTFENNNLIWFPTNYENNNFGAFLLYIISLFNDKLKLYSKFIIDYNENIGNVNSVPLNTSLWQWNLYLAQVYNINEKIGVTLITNYYSPELYDFYKAEQGFRTDLKFSTKLFKNKVEGSVMINDLFNTYFNKLTGNYNGFKSFRYSDFSTRSVVFSVRYNFQSGKKVESKQINIDNSEEEGRITK